MGHRQADARPQQHRAGQRKANQHRTGHCRTDQRQQQFHFGERRHEIIDNGPLHLARKESEAGIGEGVLHHAHDDQPRRDERGEVDAENLPVAAPHCEAEYDKK